MIVSRLDSLDWRYIEESFISTSTWTRTPNVRFQNFQNFARNWFFRRRINAFQLVFTFFVFWILAAMTLSSLEGHRTPTPEEIQESKRIHKIFLNSFWKLNKITVSYSNIQFWKILKVKYSYLGI